MFSIGVKDFLRPMLGSVLEAKRLDPRTSWITLNQSLEVAFPENSNFGYLGRFFLFGCPISIRKGDMTLVSSYIDFKIMDRIL